MTRFTQRAAARVGGTAGGDEARPGRARPPSPRRFGWEPYLHLVYLGWLFSQPAFTPDAPPLLWATVPAGILSFLPLYFASYRAGPTGRARIAAAMAALGFALAWVNTGAAVFYVFAAATMGTSLRGRALVRAVALLLLVTAAQGLTVAFVQGGSTFAALTYLFCLVFVVVVAALTHIQADRGRANARLRLAQDEVERLARVAERERIARDLHDLLGHSLSLIVLKAELARRLFERDPDRAAAEVADLERIARSSLAEMRGAVTGYRATSLAGELDNARLAFEAAGVRASFDVDGGGLDPGIDAVLALALREGVTNVIRHAAAGSCRVSLRTGGGSVVLTVEDDGVGGDAPAGSGLSGMRERVDAIGGRVDRTSGEAGTTLRVQVPAPTGPPHGARPGRTPAVDA